MSKKRVMRPAKRRPKPPRVSSTWLCGQSLMIDSRRRECEEAAKQLASMVPPADSVFTDVMDEIVQLLGDAEITIVRRILKTRRRKELPVTVKYFYEQNTEEG